MCTVLLLLVLAAPFGVPGQSALRSAVALICVFFWSLVRPASLPGYAVLMLGLVIDLTGVSMFGLATLTLLGVYSVVRRWLGEWESLGPLVAWLAFMAVAAGAVAWDWLMICVVHWRVVPVLSASFEWALAAGLYPAVAALFSLANRGIAAPERA